MKKLFLLILILFIHMVSFAQQVGANYDENKMPAYSLPDPLKFENGKAVTNNNDWGKRRAEILKIFEHEVYGISPVWRGKIIAAELSSDKNALNGLAISKEIRLTLKNGSKEHAMTMLLILPKNQKKTPVILGYNFNGNHTVTTEKDIELAKVWPRNISTNPVTAPETTRGSSTEAWQVKEIISGGYGLATIYYGDVDPDFDDGFKNGVHGLYDKQPDSTSWGSIAAWAWGLSRVLDYLETVPDVDPQNVIVFGHSRLGKAALWAGATDERFAGVISNDSGCGGAALSKRIFGETVVSINKAFPHWFCENFNKYNGKEELLPVDQHELLALIAPRPLYVASAEEDKWADPKGEFLSCVAASPVWKLFGKGGFQATEMPVVNSPIKGSISYHIRTGGHDVTLYDWKQYIEYAKSVMKK